jgi:CheY-like chemotaxis protein
MTMALRILLIEDDPFYCELLSFAFKRKGIQHSVHQVDNGPDLRAAIPAFDPHVIICDFSLPEFDGFEALVISGALYPQAPFFFSSGTVGRVRAQLALKMGAPRLLYKATTGNYWSKLSACRNLRIQIHLTLTRVC